MLNPSVPPATLAELAQRSFVNFAAHPCLGAKDKGSGSYVYATYDQVAQRVRAFACALVTAGIERGERVAILSENSPEWAIADIACQMRGAISVPLFSTLPSVQVAGILRDCGARAIVVSDKSQLQKVLDARENLPDLQHIIVMDEKAASEESRTFAAWEEQGRKYLEGRPEAFEELWPAAQTDDVATIIYTSGTTGEPKGVMLSHRNLCANIKAITALLEKHLELGGSDVFLSFLPLAHIFERTAGFWVPIRAGSAVAYSESLRTVDKNMREARPTVMFSVPRFYEMLAEKVGGAASTLPEAKRGKYNEAIALARKSGRHRGGIEGAPAPSLIEKIKLMVFEKAVYSKVREKFGGRLKAFVSGGAPLSPEIAALFVGMNITVLEGYGLTETSPVIAVNLPGAVRIGTVGEVLENVECKIEADGEICVRGDSITRGYWGREAETRDCIDEDNWFHTGDIGQLTEEKGRKYLRITDRKKDLLVLANGKKVAPAPIELRLAQSPLISQVVLLGDKQKAVSALIVPQIEALRLFAAKQNLGLTNDEDILASSEVQKRVREEIDLLSKDLADFEKIKKFTLLSNPFTIENGEMTPTLKVKRRVVAEKYGVLVEA
jgi:long-chain acyl-CoA synthetase